MNTSKGKSADNLTSLLSQKGLVVAAPRIDVIEQRVEKCREDGRPFRILYGETFDEQGNTLDSVKYYLFTSKLAKLIGSKYEIAVEPTILVADLGVFRNYPDQIREMRGYAEDRQDFATNVRETYNGTFEVKLLSDIATTDEFMVRLEKVRDVSRSDDALMQMIIATVPPDRREESAKNGYIYSMEEIATILGIDIKVGPPREQLYDNATNSMLSHFGVDPLLPVYLTQTYPLGMPYSSYINLPIAKYGLTPYKAGSSQLADSRIIIGRTAKEDVVRLINDTEIEPARSKPNPVLDILMTADLARQHMEGQFDSDLANAVYKRYYDKKLDPADLKARTYSELERHILDILPTSSSAVNEYPPAPLVPDINPWGGERLGKEQRSAGFVISDITQEIKEFFGSSTPLFTREIALGHTDFDRIVDAMMYKDNFTMISGFSSSGEFHYGHKVVIDTYNFFRKSAGSGYFAVCDIDAYVSRPDTSISSLETARRYAIDNITDALAMGVPREDIYLQSRQSPDYFTFAFEVSKIIPYTMMENVLGHKDTGKYSAVYLQIADILYPQISGTPAPSLIPVGIDQKPIIRLTKEVANRSKGTYSFIPPSVLYLAHMPSLIDYSEKMSKSKPGSALLLGANQAEFESAIANAITGGRNTKAEQEELGGRPEVCPIYEMHRFNNPSDEFVSVTFEACKAGTLMCGADKAALKESTREALELHRQKREEYAQIATEIVRGATS